MTDRLSEPEQREEILAAILFYEARGLDWRVVVAFLAAQAIGMWPPPQRTR